jgi:hypothetical protein
MMNVAQSSLLPLTVKAPLYVPVQVFPVVEAMRNARVTRQGAVVAHGLYSVIVPELSAITYMNSNSLALVVVMFGVLFTVPAVSVLPIVPEFC